MVVFFGVLLGHIQEGGDGGPPRARAGCVPWHTIDRKHDIPKGGDFFMKKHPFRTLFAVLALLVLGTSAFAEDIKSATIVLDPWPPYSVGETNKAPTGGYFIDVCKEAFSRMGVEADIMLYPWKRCLKNMETGDSDVLLGVTKTAEREKFMTYTDPVVVDRVVFFYVKEKHPNGFSWANYGDLKEITIGTTAGYNYGEAFNAGVKEQGIKLDEGESETKNFEKLMAGRIDLFVCYEISGKYWVNANDAMKGKIDVAENPVLAEMPFYLAFSNKGKALPLVPKLNETLAAMKADGTTDKLLGK